MELLQSCTKQSKYDIEWGQLYSLNMYPGKQARKRFNQVSIGLIPTLFWHMFALYADNVYTLRLRQNGALLRAFSNLFFLMKRLSFI